MKNKILIFFSLIILLLGVLLAYIVINNKKNNNESSLVYKIVYYDDGEPGFKYDIEAYNNKILLSKTHFSSVAGGKQKVDDFVDLKYSQVNVDKFIQFINNNFGTSNLIELNKNKLTKKQNDIIRSLSLGENYFEYAIDS